MPAFSYEIQKLVQQLIQLLEASTVAWKCGMTEAYATRFGRRKNSSTHT